MEVYGMAELVSDELWERIEPLLPPLPVPSPKGGRPPVSNRQALTGIVFVLRTGIPWQMLPKEMNCGSGSTCWRRFAAWTALGVWPRLHALLLTILGKAGAIHLERAVMDSASVRAVFGGRTPDRTPRIERNPAANATF
jgi:transposase